LFWMENVLFLQSEVADPHAFYDRMRLESPWYYDELNRTWAVYTFSGCQAVLMNSSAWIPQPNGIYESLSSEALEVVQNLVRLSNPPEHTFLRTAALSVFERLNQVDVAPLIQQLLGEPRLPAQFDWVNDIAKKLPAIALLHGLGFKPGEMNIILPEVEPLAKLMLQTRTAQESDRVNLAIERISNPVKSYVGRTLNLSSHKTVQANLIGLLIQSYDALRGALSNSFLKLVSLDKTSRQISNFYSRLVAETLRFDSPVHNTRRVLSMDMNIDGTVLRRGASVLAVLASANRDTSTIHDADIFNLKRGGSTRHLSFGAGRHQCIAEKFSMNLTIAALQYLDSKYNTISILDKELRFEPRVNVRLPIRIQFSIQ